MTVLARQRPRLGRFLARIQEPLRGLPLPIAIVYLLVSLSGVVLWNHPDLWHTVGASYGYLLGHPLDFYDYNTTWFTHLDYYPTVYLIFAIWMAPVKLIVSPGVQNGMNLSAVETAWARLLLLLAFLATFYVMHLIAKQLFPESERRQAIVRFTFLLSPFAAFAIGVHGQYDIFGVFFAMLGFYYYLRGDKWRFALFFGIAASCKYFALLIFVPLLVLRYKKLLREIIPLGLVGLSVLALEAAVYFHNTDFRGHTMFAFAGTVAGRSATSDITHLVEIILVVGTILLWRFRPSSEDQLRFVAIVSAATAYGLLFLAITWEPQWLIVMAPFIAMATAYLKRPLLFIVFETLAFFGYIVYVIHMWPAPGGLDVSTSAYGALHSFLPTPRLLLTDLYSVRLMAPARYILVAYMLAVVFFAVGERVLRVRDRDPEPGTKALWWVRGLTFPLIWTVPALFAVFAPLSIAEHLNPAAAVVGKPSVTICSANPRPYGELTDGNAAVDTFSVGLDKLSGLSFEVASYGRGAEGTLHLVLSDQAGTTVATGSVDLAKVADNSWVYFTFPAIAGSKGQVYTSTLSTSGTTGGHGIALWGSKADCSGAATASFAGKPVPGDFYLKYYGG